MHVQSFPSALSALGLVLINHGSGHASS